MTNSIFHDNTASGFNGGSGGAIANLSRLTLIKCLVSGNTVSRGDGGGIANYRGTLMLFNSLVSGNRANGGNGGGISNYQGKITLTNSEVSNNTVSGGNGGGISNYQGTVTLTNMIISKNRATSGGGISNYGSILTLTNTTVSGNSSDGGNGGGISNQGFQTHNGTLTLTNTTVSSNTAIYHNGYGGSGGGIFFTSSQANIVFCTIYGNTATRDGGGITTGIEDQTRLNQVLIRYSIMAANRAVHGQDISGSLTSYGYNLIQSVQGATFNTNKQHQTDILSVNFADLRIDPELKDNGGSTQPQTWTHALLQGSPAIDQIPLSACHLNGISTDQRGVNRPQGLACDIGAYEYISS